MSRRQTVEDPYLPVKGINPDSNGLSLDRDECVWAKNLQSLMGEVRTRPGERKFADNIPDVSNPILHTHTYKKPTGDQVLFGFTKDEIHVYNDATDRWLYAIEFDLLDDCDNVTDWSTGISGGVVAKVDTLGYDSEYIKVTDADPTSISDGDRILGKTITAGLDASDQTHISFRYLCTLPGVTTLDVKVKFYSDTGYSSLIESFDKTLTITVPGVATHQWQSVRVKMGTPASFSAIKSWEVVADGAVSETEDFFFGVDYLCAVTPLANDVEFWSTDDFIDNTEGAIVIAAGSNPPKANQPEDDGASRVLYRYDRTDGYFSPWTISTDTYTYFEDTGEVVPTNGVKTGDCDNITGSITLVAGTFSIITADGGTLATSSAIVNSGPVAGSYALIPVNDSKIAAGGSWVKPDGTWQIKFRNNHGYTNGAKLFVSYQRRETTTYKPRFVRNFHNRVIMGNLYDGTNYFPWRVRWGFVGNMALIDALAYADLVDTDVSGITAMVMQGYYLIIYKIDAIVQARYVGGSSTFSFTVVWNDGTFAGNTVVQFQQKHYLLGKDDVYVWDGAR